MIASLPMYLRPETRGALDTLWGNVAATLRDLGIDAPAHLDHDAPVAETWARDDLLLGQICNLPYRLAFAERVRVVALGDHRLPDTLPGHYHSVLVARADDPRTRLAEFADAPVAINSADSQSGWGAIWSASQAAGLTLGPVRATGAHRDSARAVADGRADLAAIDAVTWRMIARWDDWAGRLKVLSRTPPTPGLAFITAAGNDPAPIRAALTEGLAALPPEKRETLSLHAIVAPSAVDYAALPCPPAPPN